MTLASSRRTLAAMAVAATFALVVPGVAQALPSPDRVEPRSFVLELLAAPVEWAQSLFSITWSAYTTEIGSGMDPDGIHANRGDIGSGMDPDGES